MAKITIKGDLDLIEHMALKEGTVTIGRERDNDIQIDDPAVSGYHAKLVSFFKPTYIQDLRSTNGTYVNGTRVVEHTLECGDIITIGKHKIFFDNDGLTTSDEKELTQELSPRDISLILKVDTTSST